MTRDAIPPGYVNSTCFIQATTDSARAKGCRDDHPVLCSPTYPRNVIALLQTGRIPSVRIRNRFYADLAHAPRAVEMLGLVPPAVPAAA